MLWGTAFSPMMWARNTFSHQEWHIEWKSGSGNKGTKKELYDRGRIAHSIWSWPNMELFPNLSIWFLSPSLWSQVILFIPKLQYLVLYFVLLVIVDLTMRMINSLRERITFILFCWWYCFSFTEPSTGICTITASYYKCTKCKKKSREESACEKPCS